MLARLAECPGSIPQSVTMCEDSLVPTFLPPVLLQQLKVNQAVFDYMKNIYHQLKQYENAMSLINCLQDIFFSLLEVLNFSGFLIANKCFYGV